MFPSTHFPLHLPYNKLMRTWSLGPQDPRSLTLSADFRFCQPDYFNDHTWEIESFRGDAAVFGTSTSYGLQARSMRIFPAFTIKGRRVVNPTLFFSQPKLKTFYPNYLSFTCSPFENLDVLVEIWVPSSNTIASRITLDNQDFNALDMQLEVVALLQPIEGSLMIPSTKQYVSILSGKTGNLQPVIFLTGGPEHGSGSPSSLELNLHIPALSSRKFTWAQAALADEQSSFDLARRTAALPWDVETTRIRIINEAQSLDVETGNPDWDAAFALTQSNAFRLFFQAGEHLPQPAFVLSRQPDHGWSSRGDGLDHVSSWSGVSPLDVHYLSSLLPAAPGLIAGMVRNFLSTQKADGFVDFRPGMAGQRGHHLAPPILASLAWESYQSTGEREFLVDVYPCLLEFMQYWLKHVRGENNDILLTWDHALQTGLEDHPAFSGVQGSNPKADIRFLESPGLAAFLWREFRSLESIAGEIDRSEEIDFLREKVNTLPELVQICRSAKDGLYHYRDRESHRLPVGKQVLTAKGEGTYTSRVKFKNPERLLVVIQTLQPSRRTIKISIQGLSENGSPQQEVLTYRDLIWESERGFSGSRLLFTAVQQVKVNGLTRSGKLVIRTMDTSFTDPTSMLPLWAGLSSPEDVEKILNTIINDETGEILLSSRVKDEIRFPWLQFLGEGLLVSGNRVEASKLINRIMDLTIRSLKQQGSFFDRYTIDNGSGTGERNSLHGLAPLGLFLKTLGVQIISPQQVRLEGSSPFPWPVTLRHRGLVVVRDPGYTEITFPDGRKVRVDDPDACIVSIQ